VANEIQIIHDDGAETVYAIIRETAATGKWWHIPATAEFITFAAAQWAHYAITLTEVDAAASGNVAVQGTWPAALTTAGFYWLDVYVQAGANPAQIDNPAASYLMYWNGTTLTPAGGAADVRQIEGSAPAAADVAKESSVGAIATILAGITSLANWLRGLYRKDTINSTALSEINSGGGAYSATTDSNEALADKTGGLTAQETRDAMKLAPSEGDPAAGSIDAEMDNVPANVWANPVRTLTMSAAEAAAAMTGGASNSFLTRTRANIREFAGEPGIHAKYSDARLLDWIEMAFSKVFGALSRRADNPICMTYDITLSSGQPHYQLPPTCQRVLQAQVFTAGDMDNPVWELHPRARSHPAGYNIVFEHTTVRLSPATIAQLDGYVLRVTFVPSGCVKLHTASIDTDDDDDDTGNITNGTTTATVVLPTQTNINATGAGTLDLRPNAYGGSIFRVLAAGTANYVQERLITAYDVTTRTLTLSPQFDAGLVPATDTDTNVAYEIAPPLVEQFDAVIAAWVAMMIVGLEGDKARYGGIATLYQDMLSDAAKQVQNFNGITSGTLNGGSSGGSSGSMASLMNRGR